MAAADVEPAVSPDEQTAEEAGVLVGANHPRSQGRTDRFII